MSTTSSARRNTRAASRAGSIEPAPSVGGSARSTRAGTRRAAEELRSKSTQLYGTSGEIDHAARKQQQEGMESAVEKIQGGLGASARGGGGGGRLSAVAEEGQDADHNSTVGSNVSRSIRSRKVSQLTAIKSFGRESAISARVGNPNWEKNVEGWVDRGPEEVRSAWTVLTWRLLDYLFWILFVGLFLCCFWLWNSGIGSLPTKFTTISHHIGNRLDTTDHQLDMTGRRLSMTDDRLDITINKVDQTSTILRHLEARLDNIEHRNYRRVNYFSWDLGARVNPYLTSPRIMRPALTPQFSWLSWASWFGYSPLKLKMQFASKGSDQALKGWSEALDRWCAPSIRGKLQLAILMPRTIIPETFLIEHFHRNELILFGAAPKEVELWIRILDDEVRNKVIESVLVYWPDIMTPRVSQEGKTLDENQALDHTWAPIGRWIYDIDTVHNVQRFDIMSPLHVFGVAVNEAVVRVNSNWGSLDSTCLYRVVLQGRDVSGVKEYLEDGY